MSEVAMVDLQTGEIVERSASGLPTTYDPGRAKVEISKLDAVIEHCKRVQDWPTLERAVSEKIEQQAEFVQWWDENITPRRGTRTDISVERRISHTLKDIERETGISNQQVSRWRRALKDPQAYAAKVYAAAYKKAMAMVANHLAQGTGENEWYTPADIIELAREVLGEIDLDPASNPEANETIRATQYYTAADNGLTKPWIGRVWLNPPYSRDLMPAFVSKLISEHENGNVTAAILVSHNNTDTAWFQSLAAASTAICLPSTRIKFYRGDDVASPVNGQAFFYLGLDHGRFFDVFRQLGVVVHVYP